MTSQKPKRILFLSNFYPPARSGGYTQWCHEVAQGLQERGHTIGVLTSCYELQKAPAGEPHIHRLLHLDGDLNYYRPRDFFLNWPKKHRANLACTRQVVQAFAPDVAFVWGMWAMSHAVPALLEQLLPGRVVYFLSDYWPSAASMHTAYWQQPANRPVMRLPKWIGATIARAILRRAAHPPLAFQHAICVSAAVRDILARAGLPLQQARVIHGGTDPGRFAHIPAREWGNGRLRLLYAGQLAPHKGVHTTVAAMNQLVNEQGNEQVHLTIVGSGHPAYEAQLHRQVETLNLQPAVTFWKSVTREEVPDILAQFDVLIFPSVYEEPLARMTQEAMAAGLVVIGTTTGGTKEILTDGQTGLTFAPEDDHALAAQIAHLAADPTLCQRLAETGRAAVLDYFNLDRMIGELEAYLLAV